MLCIPCLSEKFLVRVKFRTSKMEYKMDISAKIIDGYRPSTIFVKNSISDVPLMFKYHSADRKPLLAFSKSQAADLFPN